MLAASAWWVLPLLVLGRYSPPFLDVIETSRATTGPLGWSNVARGLDDWLFFVVVDGQPWWAGAARLASSPALVAATAAVAALGFVGLLHRRMPARLPLAASALLGTVLMVLGHDGGVLASPLAGITRDLLDGGLAPLRNVHKLDPIVRLPLALGLAHLVGVLVARRWADTSRVRRRLRRRRRLALAGAAVATAVALLVASAWPLVAGTARQAGWTEVPVEWRQAATYLGAHADEGRTWVLPGSGFGRQTWGRTVDEPIQPLARAAWVTRSQVPLVPQQTMRYLDALEARVSDGRGSPALADALARAGIGHVLLRHDLAAGVTSAPSSQRVGAALRQSGGLTLVESFDDDDGRSRIDLYRVERPVDLVDLTPAEEVTRVSGAPDDVIGLLEGGIIAPDRPTQLVATGAADVDAVGDAFQRRERQFGRTYDAVGPLLGADEAYRQERAVHDYAGPPGVDRVTATSASGARATASSSSGFTDSVGPVRPELGPAAAVDGSLETMWRSAPLTDPVRQWLEVTLPSPRPVEHVDVRAAVDGFTGIPVRRVKVTAGEQTVEQAVDPESGFARVRLSGTPVSSVRVSVSAVRGGAPTGVVALREVTVPGVDAVQQAVLPGAVAPGTDLHVHADRGRRACTGTNETLRCEPGLAPPERRGHRAAPGVPHHRTGHLDAVRNGRGNGRARDAGAARPAGRRRHGARVDGARRRPAGGPGVRARRRPDDLVVERGRRSGTLDHGELGRRAHRVGHPSPDGPHPHPCAPHRSRRHRRPGAGGDRGRRRHRGAAAGQGTRGDGDLPGRHRHRGAAAPPRRRRARDRRRAGPRLPPRPVVGHRCPVRAGAAPDARRAFGRDGGARHPCGRPGGHVTGSAPLHGTRGAPQRGAPPRGALDRPVRRHLAHPDRTGRPRAHGRGAVAHRGGLAGHPPRRRRRARRRVGAARRRELQPGVAGDAGRQALEPVVLDGWQQGYRVPAGAGGRVVIDFTPDRAYRAGLWSGGGLALVLLVSTLVAIGAAGGGRLRSLSSPGGCVRPASPPRGPLSLSAAPSSVACPWSPGPRRNRAADPARARLVAAGACVAAGGLVTATALATGQGYFSGLADLVGEWAWGCCSPPLPGPADTRHPR